MIKRSLKLSQRIIAFNFSENRSPIIFSKGSSAFSLSQLWNGIGEKPTDYFVKDNLNVKVDQQWKLQDGLFRVLFTANLSEASMNININHLRKSVTLNQLIQLEATEKEELVNNPSTVIITPNLIQQTESQENQISKNILEIDQLFSGAVGLKISYLIDANSLQSAEYIQQLKSREKAISADVVKSGHKFAQLVYSHGYKLEHIFLDSTTQQPNNGSLFRYDYSLSAVIEALSLINFKGKLILPGGERYEAAIQAVSIAAKENGYTQKLQFELDNDGWHTML